MNSRHDEPDHVDRIMVGVMLLYAALSLCYATWMVSQKWTWMHVFHVPLLLGAWWCGWTAFRLRRSVAPGKPAARAAESIESSIVFSAIILMFSPDGESAVRFAAMSLLFVWGLRGRYPFRVRRRASADLYR